MSPDDPGRQVFATAAALLDAERLVGALSRALTVLAFTALLLPLAVPVRTAGLCALSVSALAGLAGLYVGIRLAFDAALFQRLAGAGTLAALDGALSDLGLVPAARVGRSMADRFAGARRLMQRRAALLCVQAGALLAAAWIA